MNKKKVNVEILYTVTWVLPVHRDVMEHQRHTERKVRSKKCLAHLLNIAKTNVYHMNILWFAGAKGDIGWPGPSGVPGPRGILSKI